MQSCFGNHVEFAIFRASRVSESLPLLPRQCHHGPDAKGAQCDHQHQSKPRHEAIKFLRPRRVVAQVLQIVDPLGNRAVAPTPGGEGDAINPGDLVQGRRENGRRRAGRRADWGGWTVKVASGCGALDWIGAGGENVGLTLKLAA